MVHDLPDPKSSSVTSYVEQMAATVPSQAETAIADTALPYKLLLSCPLGLSPSQVSVDFDESYDRIPHPDTDSENSISEIWDARIQKNASLFNGKKFRYAGCSLPNERNGSTNISLVALHLGLTDYRTFVGTNLNPLWERFLVPSEEGEAVSLTNLLLQYDPVRCQHTSSPLGNGAVVETSDKRIVILRRSNNVGEFPGHFVFPGGHPEPEEAGITSHQNGKSLTESELINRKVSEEMFESIIREVVEEIGVPASALSNPLFIGISRRELNVRPAAFFFMSCCLSAEEIQQCYSTAQDGFESTQLHAVTLIELEKLATKMPGCHLGGFALYKLMLEARKET
ncbi:nudix hydrolase 9 isoform X2 [Punica granatum]|uniref:Nudix hydrolase 9 isoform X2 n=1 Tax=Punica granatum TaxID=22663 RepID=A0A6P8DY08_PUNGR|nr:nudix hydrolase 9 isoform X2 [Punica granatum]